MDASRGGPATDAALLLDRHQPHSAPKFPSTKHLFDASRWYRRKDGGSALGAGDSLLEDPQARGMFLGGSDVVVEEKMDGTNLAVCFPPAEADSLCSGHLLPKPAFRHRGSGVCSTTSIQYGGKEGKGIDAWFYPRHRLLWELLGHRYVLYGELCYVVHSVKYDRLPDLFIAFDVFDCREGRYLSASRRDDMLLPAGIKVVRCVPCALPSSEEQYRELLYGPDRENGNRPLLSQFSRAGITVEGIYMRVEADGFLKYRAKVVRHDFIQGIEEEGRFEKQIECALKKGNDKAVWQECETVDWGYFYATLCNGNEQVIHAPPELCPAYDE